MCLFLAKKDVHGNVIICSEVDIFSIILSSFGKDAEIRRTVSNGNTCCVSKMIFLL